MGRRALRKIDPSLDLSPYLYELERLTPPLDSASLFPSAAPLEIEMGSGKGLFLAAASSRFPDRNFLGVEVARKYAAYCAARLARSGVSNACMISGDGLQLFREFLTDSLAEDVHVYFPDPWWKKRHRKRRVMNEPFLRDVQRVLKPGGRLHFWTDVEEYYLESLDVVADCTQLRGPLPVPETAATHDLDYRTHFERRTRLGDLPVFRAKFAKPVD